MTTTRRQLLMAGAASAIGLPAAARADTGADRGLLEVMARYTAVVVFSYDLALHSAPLRGGDRAMLTKLRAVAEEEDNAVRAALTRTGGTPPPPRPATFSQLPPEIARKADRAAYLRYVITNEEGAVTGWYAVIQQLADATLVKGAATYMAAGGRRLVVLRNLAGEPLLPRAFETGGP